MNRKWDREIEFGWGGKAMLFVVCHILLTFSLHAQISIIKPVVPPSGSEIKFVHPDAPVLEDMGPYIIYELRDFRLPIRTVDWKYASISAENLPIGAKIMSSGSIQENNAMYHFEWTPDWNDAGYYEITLTASNDYGNDTATLKIYVFNNKKPHVSIEHVHMKTVRNGNMMRYYFLPLIKSDGDKDLERIELRVTSDSDEIVWLDREEVINWEDVYQVNNQYWEYNHAYVFEAPVSALRRSVPFSLAIDAETPGGETWTQEIEFNVGIGDLADDFYGTNSSSLVFKHRYQADVSIYGYKSGYDNPVRGSQWRLAGEIVAIGDFDGDEYEDLIFQDGSTISYAISELDHGGGDFWVTHISAKRNVVGSGDFNGDGVDTLVVRDLDSRVIEKWPFDAELIDLGWVDSWNIPRGFDLLKIADFDGDMRDDFLWYDTHEGLLVLWRNGEGAVNEVVLGAWTGRERVRCLTNVNGQPGCDIVYQFNGDKMLYVAGFIDGSWANNGVDSWNQELWEVLSAVDYAGSSWGSQILIRDRIDRSRFVFASTDGIEGGATFRYFKQVEHLDFEHAADFDGDGTEDLVFSERKFDPDIQRDRKYYTILHSDDRWEPTITEVSLPIEWELQKFH